VKITPAQLRALRWLHNNGGLTVPNMNMHGRSKEWPDTRTLRALVNKDLCDFEQSEFDWTVRPSKAGLEAIGIEVE
jgi:hypothetical protein